jgi:predicted 3-demethylubiquinone-9 3-methyltransferase (glyoxalase superfamily)
MVTIAAPKVVPHLWFAERAVEAGRFHVSPFPDSPRPGALGSGR